MGLKLLQGPGDIVSCWPELPLLCCPLWMLLTSLKPSREVLMMPPKCFPSVIMWENYVDAYRAAPLQFIFQQCHSLPCNHGRNWSPPYWLPMHFPRWILRAGRSVHAPGGNHDGAGGDTDYT